MYVLSTEVSIVYRDVQYLVLLNSPGNFGMLFMYQKGFLPSSNLKSSTGLGEEGWLALS